ncbi:NTP transferase domain-containing protein [Sinomonas halotolerans]|uniref:NTP transferase domain-containing protein n=1 Tax=Sinomonas halotolerans TaxID=1644133 RepID=A0ABU9WVW8_9MICC
MPPFDTVPLFDAAPLFDAVVVAGGRASRLGGFPKPLLRIGGQTLLERALRAVSAAGTVVVVGPAPDPAEAPAHEDPGPTVLYTLEEPRFGGPLAAVGSGVRALAGRAGTRAPWTAVLAADLPRAAEAFAPLAVAAAGEPACAGIAAQDETGRLQPLLALYRSDELARALEALAAQGGLADRPLRHLVARLDLLPLQLPPGLADDVDTWEAAARWGIRRPDAPGAAAHGEDPSMSEPSTPGQRPTDGPEQDAVLHAWCDELAEGLGLSGLEVDVDAVLGLAGVAAHTVLRPAAPLTTFLAAYAAGLAVGRGQAEPGEASGAAVSAALRITRARRAAGTEG